MNERRRRFEQLVLPHLDAAYNLARWLAAQEADDVVQDAMLRAFRAFDGFRGGDAKPWLLAIVRNCHYTLAGQKAKRRSVPLPEDGEQEIATDAPDPEVSAIGADRARKLNRAIAELPEEFREALVLREMEDMSYREIADITGAPIGTVMSRLARARALLRERWSAATQEAAP
jgi:RNA polymerase sigma-70 factor (ECF subfamily)